MDNPQTFGELQDSGYRLRSVRAEMRDNLVGMLERGERILPGIIGFDATVIPEVENAILAGHHMVFLGERGQAKSRIIRGLTALLDELVPAVRGCAIHDRPAAGTAVCIARNRSTPTPLGDAWLPLAIGCGVRMRRYCVWLRSSRANTITSIVAFLANSMPSATSPTNPASQR